MIATRISSLRAAVIQLLRRNGNSPIDATDLWDTVYSKQIQNATPGIHKLLIGEYVLEYTVPFEPPRSDLVELITKSNNEAHEAEIASQLRGKLQAIVVIIIVVVTIYLTSTVFEDGSFIVLGYIKGCLPWGICN